MENIEGQMSRTNNSSVWYKKYEPSCVSDLILPEKFKTKLQKMVNTQKFRHMLLCSNTGGTGKSATCSAILKEINGEALWVNASLDNGIGEVRGRISKFASQESFDDNIKVVIMDEFDHVSSSAMAAFRGFLDDFGDNCVFIFTCNFKDKIIEPLLTRLEVIDYNDFNKQEMLKPIFHRLAWILKNENVEFKQEDLVPIINTYYPSIRSMIGSLQKNANNGVLEINDSDLDAMTQLDKVMQLVSANTYTEMIQSVNSLNTPDNMYKYLYQNGGKYFDQSKYPELIVTIAKYQHMSASVRDKALNLAACLTELIRLKG